MKKKKEENSVFSNSALVDVTAGFINTFSHYYSIFESIEIANINLIVHKKVLN